MAALMVSESRLQLHLANNRQGVLVGREMLRIAQMEGWSEPWPASAGECQEENRGPFRKRLQVRSTIEGRVQLWGKCVKHPGLLCRDKS